MKHVNIYNLEECTPLEVFDHIATHLLRQKQHAMRVKCGGGWEMRLSFGLGVKMRGGVPDSAPCGQVFYSYRKYSTMGGAM